MILVRIGNTNRDLVLKASKILLAENLAMDVNFKEHVQRLNLVNGELQFSNYFMITAKTRGFLFPKIDDRLKEEFGDLLPELYSFPIVHMDWDQANDLHKEIKSTD